MPAPPDDPAPLHVTADRGGERKIRVAEERWENEGGHFPSLPSVAITPGDVSPVVRNQAAEGDDLAAMRAKFLADFASGSMGRHHNTYQHRARLLRQMTGEPPQ